MEKQIQSLKLNVTNIKSHLVNSNKQLRTLKVQKMNLVSKLEKQSEVRAKEDKLETKNLGIGSGFSNIIGAVTAPARSIFDKILEFFGLIALGILVQKLPAIIAKIEEFFNSDFIKTLGDIFNVIGFGFQKLGNLINILTPQKQKELDNELKLIENEIDDGFKLTDQSNQDLNEFEKRLREKEKELQSSQSQSTPSSSPPSVPMAPMIPGSMYPFTIPQSSPNPQTPQKFSKGGTVKPSSNKDQVNLSTSPPTPRQSGEAKAAQRSSETGFLGFYNASNDLGEVARSQQESVNNFEMMVYNFKRWSSLSGKEGAPRSPGSPGAPGSGPLSGQQFSYTPPTGNAAIDIWPGQGVDATGEPGLDFSFRDYKNNYSLFAGEVIDTPVYSGYGQSLRIRSKDPATGKVFDALYAHFPPGQVKVKVGDKVTPGQFLGPVGWDHKNNRPIRGAGNMNGPHTSVDFFEPGTLTPYSNAGGVTGSVIKQKGKPPKGTQPPNPVSEGATQLLNALANPNGGGGGGNRKLLNTSNNRGNQSVFIYAVQPVETFVPFPYPVPIERPSSPAPQKSKLPEIWRP